MKKFMVLTFGYVVPTDEVQKAWGDWFSAVAPRLVDPGNPFGRSPVWLMAVLKGRYTTTRTCADGLRPVDGDPAIEAVQRVRFGR